MTTTIQEITEAALPHQIESTWTQEIRTRVDDIVTGRVKAIPWDEVKAQLMADRISRLR